MRSVTPSRCGADDWTCTSIIRRLAKSSHVGISRSAVIRTLSTSFGGWLLSQENTPVIRALSSDRARFNYDLSSAFQYASLINFDQLSILEACSE